MRPKERRDSGQNDFFKARLDQIIDMDRALAKSSVGRSTGASSRSGPARSIPTRSAIRRCQRG